MLAIVFFNAIIEWRELFHYLVVTKFVSSASFILFSRKQKADFLR